MAISIVESVLGTTNPYASTYIDNTLLLAKSITVVSHIEADMYNEYVHSEYGSVVNEYDKTSWRYFRHLAGMYHEVDVEMFVVSRDTRERIMLSRDTLISHYETKSELAKFGEFYDEVVLTYPEQELLLKSLITFSELPKIADIVKYPDWRIVGYNELLVETRETNLIPELQERIVHYAVKHLITDYAAVDDLFLSVLIAKLHMFIIKSLRTIRLNNARTGKVHSYHMLNFFASHHGLDEFYNYLDEFQRLYLYRNLLYLNTHAGHNDTFDDVIDVIFTHKRIIITNYMFNQTNKVKDDLSMDYIFYQELLNKKPFVYDKDHFDLDELEDKEIGIHDSNKDEYDYNKGDIDKDFGDTQTSDGITKDLEVTFNDSTNDVKYRLRDIILDYWATTIIINKNVTLVEFNNPVNGDLIELTPIKAFRLWILAFHKTFGYIPPIVPNYHVYRAFREERPTLDFLMSKVSDQSTHTRESIEYFRPKHPPYILIDTKRTFKLFCDKIFKYELGMWIYISSEADLELHGNLKQASSDLYRSYILENGQLDSNIFLNEIGMTELQEYSEKDAHDLAMGILNAVSDGALGATEDYKFDQISAVEIFKKFKSYTTQILSEFNANEKMFSGLDVPRYSMSMAIDLTTSVFFPGYDQICVSYKEIDVCQYQFDINFGMTYATKVHLGMLDVGVQFKGSDKDNEETSFMAGVVFRACDNDPDTTVYTRKEIAEMFKERKELLTHEY